MAAIFIVRKYSSGYPANLRNIYPDNVWNHWTRFYPLSLFSK